MLKEIKVVHTAFLKVKAYTVSGENPKEQLNFVIQLDIANILERFDRLEDNRVLLTWFMTENVSYGVLFNF